jgi:hypothetical protein
MGRSVGGLVDGELKEGALALARSCSPQFSPSPIFDHELLEALLGVLEALGFGVLAAAVVVSGGEVEVEETERLPLVLPPPTLTSRSACAPKLSRRPNGVAGVFCGGAAASPSSIASSSMGDPELEMLLRRFIGLLVKGDGCVGDVDRPNVVMDMLRRCVALAAAVVIGPGKAFVGGDCPALLDRENKPENA